MGLAAAEAAYKDGETWRLELISYLNNNLIMIEEFVNEHAAKIVCRSPMQLI